MHEAFFFGPGRQRIFAHYHPAAARGGEVLTLICPPLFSEYMRTHMALRKLAVALAERGQHVLRLDYRGTGDSFGDLDEVGVSEWIADIELSVQEGRDLSGSSAVQLVGVRAGALLACASMGASKHIRRFVLWDPVRDGADYLLRLRRMQTDMLERNLYLSRAERAGAMVEHGGFRLSARMLEEFRLLDIHAYSKVPKSRLHIVNTSVAEGSPVQGVPQYVVPFSCNWELDIEEPIIPQPVLERLVACLTMS